MSRPLSLILGEDLADALDAAAGRRGLAPNAYVIRVLSDKLGIRLRPPHPPVHRDPDDVPPATRADRVREQALKLAAHYRTND